MLCHGAQTLTFDLVLGVTVSTAADSQSLAALQARRDRIQGALNGSFFRRDDAARLNFDEIGSMCIALWTK